MWKLLPDSATAIPGSIGWTGTLGWFVIALQTFIDPNFYVRTVAATSSRIASRGLAVSVACWIVFDALQLLAGLYIIAYAPLTEPTTSYLAFAAGILPTMYRGLFVASLLAAVMSTLDGYALSSATMLVRDILPQHYQEILQLRRYRAALFVISGIGAAIAYLVPSIIDIIFYSASIAVSAVLVPLILSFSHQASALKRTIALQLIIPTVTSTLSLITHVGEPIFVGLLTSVGMASITLLHSRYATTG